MDQPEQSGMFVKVPEERLLSWSCGLVKCKLPEPLFAKNQPRNKSSAKESKGKIEVESGDIFKHLIQAVPETRRLLVP